MNIPIGVLTIAEARASANERVNESLTPEVLTWLAIEKFNDDVEIILLPSGNGLFIDPSTFLGGNTTPTPTPEIP